LIFCSRFNDALGTTAPILLQHMRPTFSDRVDTGKVSILALPRAGQARAMKLDMDDQALSDADGYEYKKMQVASEPSADDLSGVPMNFFNVESDDPVGTRKDLTVCGSNRLSRRCRGLLKKMRPKVRGP
jgi:hypothetical protein